MNRLEWNGCCVIDAANSGGVVGSALPSVGCVESEAEGDPAECHGSDSRVKNDG